MSEAGESVRSEYRRYSDFKEQSRVYDQYAGRAYNEAKAKGVTTKDVVEARLRTTAQEPLSMDIDTTGSMGQAPATIFSRTPYLFAVRSKFYLGESTEISFGSIGDATTTGPDKEQYPLQLRPYVHVDDVEGVRAAFKELLPERKGGDGVQESYELAALARARKGEFPNFDKKSGNKPIHVIVGDEQPYPFVDPEQARLYAGLNISRRLSTPDVFDELQDLHSVYLVRRPYKSERYDLSIYETWIRLIGKSRIALLLDDERISDIVQAILAKERNKVSYFWEEIKERQEPEKVEMLKRCIKPIFSEDEFALGETPDTSKKVVDMGRRTSAPLI